MFVPRSVRRIRFARAAFVVAGLLPCAVLVAWAVHRHSAAHRDGIRHAWEQAIGLPVAIDSVEHPLPGVVRARGCTLAAADGRPALAAEAVTVESTPAEVRIYVGALGCDPEGAEVLAGLAAEWLERGARFRRNLVIDVADLAWEVPGVGGRADRRPVGPVRIECVVQDGGRAVRVVRRDASANADEMRIVRTGPEARGADGYTEIEVSCTEPVPFPILAAVARSPFSGLPCGRSALLRGRLAATGVDGRWTGTASGRIAGVDLAACTAALAARASGAMEIDVEGVEWRDGRLAACTFSCDAGSGRADQRLLEALVTTLGCRAGAAYVGATAERERAFAAARCTVRIDGRGIELAGSPALGGALAVVDGRPLLQPPAGIVPAERLAWLLAPPGAVYVPSSGAGAWLMSVLPTAGGAVGRTSQAESDRSNDGF